MVNATYIVFINSEAQIPFTLDPTECSLPAYSSKPVQGLQFLTC